ncbi:MAG: cysteine desulfurase, partial [Alphaproteobacteria bacterium HGW-Alphaproteobacteria-5]
MSYRSSHRSERVSASSTPSGAGFGAAAEVLPGQFYEANVSELIRTAEEGMQAMAPDLVVFGEKSDRIGNVSNFAVPGLKNSVAMMGLDLLGLSVSS